MSRFFVSPENIFDGKIHITGTDVKHITRVLRMGPGDIITISDGGGREYEAKISSSSDQEIICAILSSTEVNREAPIKVILVQGLPKGDKMEFIIQKCTELGVAGIIPVSTKRTVVQLEGKKSCRASGKMAAGSRGSCQAGRKNHSSPGLRINYFAKGSDGYTGRCFGSNALGKRKSRGY